MSIPSGVTATVSEWRKPPTVGVVDARLDREHHPRLDRRVVAQVEERRLVVAQADRVAGVLAPVRQQVVLLEVAHHRAVDVGARDARAERGEGDLLRGDGVVEEPARLVARRPDDHGPLELGVVAPDRRARLRDEHVAHLELDVVGDRVRPGAAQADLAPVAGRRAVGRALLPAEAIAERLQHRQCRLVARPQARLGLRGAGPGVLLQQPVRVLAPASALADERELVLALSRHHPLDGVGKERDGARRRLAEGRALVAEDSRVAVLIRADRALDAHVGEHPPQDQHRMLEARILGVGLDPLERRFRAHPLDLEFGHEHHHLAACALRIDDRSLRGEEAEGREVLDVVLIEEDAARESRTPRRLRQSLTPPPQLFRSGMP